jgi:O-antigen ligase
MLIRNLYIIIIVLFSFSGALKWIPFFMDIIVFLGSLTIGITLVNLLNYDIRKIRPFNLSIFLFILFHVFYFLTSIYTPSVSYYSDKILRVLLNIFIFMAPIILLTKKRDFDYLFKLVYKLHFFLIILLIYNYFDNKFDLIFYEFESSEIKIPSYQVVSNILAIFILYNWNRKEVLNKIILALSIIFMLFLSSKGAILFLIVVFFVKLIAERKISFKNIMAIFFFMVIPVYLFSNVIFEKLLNRIYLGSDFKEDVSTQTRILLLEKGLQQFYDNPFFGTGIGGFGILEDGIDGRLAPHNIFIEVFMESGIVGGAIFVLMVVVLFNQIRKNKKIDAEDLRVKTLLNITFFLLMIDFVSGFIEDLRLSYFSLGLLVSYLIYKQAEMKMIKN